MYFAKKYWRIYADHDGYIVYMNVPQISWHIPHHQQNAKEKTQPCSNSSSPVDKKNVPIHGSRKSGVALPLFLININSITWAILSLSIWVNYTSRRRFAQIFGASWSQKDETFHHWSTQSLEKFKEDVIKMESKTHKFALTMNPHLLLKIWYEPSFFSTKPLHSKPLANEFAS